MSLIWPQLNSPDRLAVRNDSEMQIKFLRIIEKIAMITVAYDRCEIHDRYFGINHANDAIKLNLIAI